MLFENLHAMMTGMMVQAMRRYWATSCLREVLKREPSPVETLEYENEIFAGSVSRDEKSFQQVTDDFVWACLYALNATVTYRAMLDALFCLKRTEASGDRVGLLTSVSGHPNRPGRDHWRPNCGIR